MELLLFSQRSREYDTTTQEREKLMKFKFAPKDFQFSEKKNN